MIIKDGDKASFDFRKIITRTIIVVAGLLLLWGIFSFFIGKDKNAEINISTSFENKRGETFYDRGYTFSGNGFQNKDIKRTGKYSILVDSDTARHTAHLEIENPGSLYGQASVWVKIKEGNPIPRININGNREGQFSRSSGAFLKEGDDWQLLELYFVAPVKEVAKVLVIHLEVEGKGEVYFDDFEIKLSKEFLYEPKAFYPSEVNLRIDADAFAKIKRKRDEAVEAGVLVTEEDDWVDAKLIDGETVLDAKVRLKGDWRDHLMGDKWSFRVKFKKDHTWKRLKTVSFQTPEARTFVSEWVLHKLWEREDVLTTRYDFILFKINGESRGIYAYEEHFEKQLLEYKNRREGPIVKFDDADIWARRKRIMKSIKYVPEGMTEMKHFLPKADIASFGKNKILKSPQLSKQYEEAQNLMQQFQFKEKKVDEVFDIDQSAKYYAICDLMNAHHATVWHNQRFYYNPAINKLEPIGFDGNAGILKLNLDFRGQKYFLDPVDKDYMHVFANLADDTTFIRKYMYYLNEFTQPEYIQSIIQELSEDTWNRSEFLKAEFENPDFEMYLAEFQAKKIQALIWPYDEYSIKAFTAKINTISKSIKIKNNHCVPMLILGTGTSKDNMNHTFKEPKIMWVNNFGPRVPKLKKIDVPIDAKYIFSKPIGLDKIVYSKINTFSTPKENTASQEIFKNITLDTTGIYTVNDNQIIFKTGKQTIDKNIIIPQGYTVLFAAGTELDFINGAAFMSKSPVLMYGEEEDPIKINSSDNSAKGFTVLQAKEKSIVNHTIFKGFDTWKYKNWNLTGAVTFYESDVDINRMTVTSNHCEDALNIIRSNFMIQQMIISNTFADGFDADFCTGEIHESRFLNTGNDGMDFSGSIIAIIDCLVDKGGDKGLSVGEESYVKVRNLIIKNSVLGVASKDLSEAIIESVRIENCQQGFAAYRKKPEYGGATIKVGEYETNNVELLYKIEKGSKLYFDNKLIEN